MRYACLIYFDPLKEREELQARISGAFAHQRDNEAPFDRPTSFAEPARETIRSPLDA